MYLCVLIQYVRWALPRSTAAGRPERELSQLAAGGGTSVGWDNLYRTKNSFTSGLVGTVAPCRPKVAVRKAPRNGNQGNAGRRRVGVSARRT